MIILKNGCMHKKESVLVNEAHQILRDFEIQTDHLIPIWRPDLLIIDKKKMSKMRTCCLVDLAVLADHRVKIKQNEKKHKYLDLTRELKNAFEHKGDCDNNCNWCAWNDPQRFDKGIVWKSWKSEDEQR